MKDDLWDKFDFFKKKEDKNADSDKGLVLFIHHEIVNFTVSKYKKTQRWIFKLRNKDDVRKRALSHGHLWIFVRLGIS